MNDDVCMWLFLNFIFQSICLQCYDFCNSHDDRNNHGNWSIMSRSVTSVSWTGHTIISSNVFMQHIDTFWTMIAWSIIILPKTRSSNYWLSVNWWSNIQKNESVKLIVISHKNLHIFLPRCLNLMQTAEWSTEWLWESKKPGDDAHSINDQFFSDSTISASLNGSLQNLPFGWSDVHLQHLSADADNEIMNSFINYFWITKNWTCDLHSFKSQLVHILPWNVITSSTITNEILRMLRIIFANIVRFLTNSSFILTYIITSYIKLIVYGKIRMLQR